MTAPILKGIFTPTMVPFSPDGSINEEELRRMINWLIEKGVHGLYPNGSTGEFTRLNFDERVRITRIVAEENRGRVPILAGAAEANPAEILKVARIYADLGCTAISITGPYYFKVSQESVEEYFRQLARQSPLEMVVYNIPQFANEISLPVVERLASDCPRIVGIKDSSRDFPRFVSTIAKIKPKRPGFSIFTGTEEILMPSLLMGADGGTIATSGVVPEVVVRLYEEATSGSVDEARRIQLKMLELIDAMFDGPIFPEGFRAAASLRGFNMGSSRQPISKAEGTRLESLRAKLACILTECGFPPELASKSPESPDLSGMVERIVRDVLKGLDHG